MDGDGDADLLFDLSPFENACAWSENLGGGFFSGLTDSFPTHVAPQCHPLDLDGDGDLDLVAASGSFDSLHARVQWAENLGSGQFADSVIIYVGLADSGATVDFGDMEGDGDLDVVALAAAGTFWIDNLGGGTFVSPVQLDSGPVSHVLVADAGEDGDLDLFLSNTGQPLRWLENTGGTQFSAPVVLSGLSSPALALADLDGDLDLDLIVRTAGAFFCPREPSSSRRPTGARASLWTSRTFPQARAPNLCCPETPATPRPGTAM